MFIFQFGQKLLFAESVGLNDIRRILQSWIKADKSTGKNENNPEKTVDKVFGKKGRFSGSLMSL